jgi:hypothetical protein
MPPNDAMALDLPPHYHDLTFMTPLSEERAARLVAFIAEHLTGTVIDIGCGWAELLLRVLEAAPGAQGIGFELDKRAIAHAWTLANARGLANRVSFIVGDARTQLLSSATAILCIGASQIWGPPVEAHLPLDYRSALTAMRAMLDRGSRLVYGEGIWTAAPTDAAIAPLAGRRDEFLFLPDLLDIARESGFMPLQVHQASLDEWDVFESGYAARYARWIANHPLDHPHAQSVRERAQAQSSAYFQGYRSILGMAYLGLVAV